MRLPDVLGTPSTPIVVRSAEEWETFIQTALAPYLGSKLLLKADGTLHEQTVSELIARARQAGVPVIGCRLADLTVLLEVDPAYIAPASR